MREQVIATRGSRPSAAHPRDLVQRPARRGHRGGGRSAKISPRALLGYVPSVLKFAFAILALIATFIGYRAAASASLFQVRSVDVSGTSRTSAEEIEGLTRRAVARTGVWRADLTAISAELGRLPGVRRAVVTRVLPDRLRVRVIERVPAAVVHTSTGHFVWVDEEGVALGEMKTTDHMPPFFIRGWSEEGTDDARKDNIERVQKYLQLVREWEAAGLAERISEVNLIDVRDVRAQLAGNDSQIEVRLGGQDPGKRLKLALDVLDEYKQGPRGALITYIDLQGGRVVIGFSSGNKVSTGTDTSAGDANSNPTASAPQSRAKGTDSNTSTSSSASTATDRRKPGRTRTERDEKSRSNSGARFR